MKKRIYLFSQEVPQGELFNLTESQLEEKLKDGWLETPAKLKVDAKEAVAITQEELDNTNPDKLIEIIQGLGFIVMTPDQLKAEAMKMADVAFNVENLTDEMIISEAVRRGLKDSDEAIDGILDSALDEAMDDIINAFNENPDEVSREDRFLLANHLGLTVRSNFGDETVNAKIIDALKDLEEQE